jgi:hypothetical protein
MTATTRAARWLFGAVLVWLVAIAAVAAGLWVWAERDGIADVQAGLSSAQPWLLGWRLTLFSVLMLYWHEIAGWLTRRAELGAAAATALRQWRWRAGAGLVLMDLILAEDVLGFLGRLVR